MERRDKLTAYTHLRVFEADYDKAQGQIRAIGSAWIIACLGAFSYLAVASYGPKPMPEYAANALMQAVFWVASTGLTALWFLDQRVYQQLLHVVFAYGVVWEENDPDLPPIRSTMYNRHLDITKHFAWLYKAPLFMFATLSAGNFVRTLIDVRIFLFRYELTVSSAAEWLLPLIIFVVHVAFLFFAIRKSKTWPSLSDMIAIVRNDFAGNDGGVPASSPSESRLKAC